MAEKVDLKVDELHQAYLDHEKKSAQERQIRRNKLFKVLQDSAALLEKMESKIPA